MPCASGTRTSTRETLQAKLVTLAGLRDALWSELLWLDPASTEAADRRALIDDCQTRILLLRERLAEME